jgi:hypothetical protein
LRKTKLKKNKKLVEVSQITRSYGKLAIWWFTIFDKPMSKFGTDYLLNRLPEISASGKTTKIGKSYWNAIMELWTPLDPHNFPQTPRLTIKHNKYQQNSKNLKFHFSTIFLC